MGVSVNKDNSAELQDINSFVESSRKNFDVGLELWCDPLNGSDVTGDGTKENPYQGLQFTLDAAQAAVGNSARKVIYIMNDYSGSTIRMPGYNFTLIGTDEASHNTAKTIAGTDGPAMIYTGYTQAGWNAFVADGGLQYTLSDDGADLVCPNSNNYEYDGNCWSSPTIWSTTVKNYFHNLYFRSLLAEPGFICFAPNRSSVSSAGNVTSFFGFYFNNCRFSNANRVSVPVFVSKNCGTIYMSDTVMFPDSAFVLDNASTVRLLPGEASTESRTRVYIRDIVQNATNEGQRYEQSRISVLDLVGGPINFGKIICQSDKPTGSFGNTDSSGIAILEVLGSIYFNDEEKAGVPSQPLQGLTSINGDIVFNDSSSAVVRELSCNNLIISTDSDISLNNVMLYEDLTVTGAQSLSINGGAINGDCSFDSPTPLVVELRGVNVLSASITVGANVTVMQYGGTRANPKSGAGNWIYVPHNGGDLNVQLEGNGTPNQISTAIADILASSRPPNVAEQYVIHLTGTFIQSSTIEIPQYVTVQGPANIIHAGASKSYLVRILPGGTLKDATLVGSVKAIHDGIVMDTTTSSFANSIDAVRCVTLGDCISILNGGKLAMSSIATQDSNRGLVVDGAGSVGRFSIMNYHVVSDIGVLVDNGGELFGVGCNVLGIDPTYGNYGYKVDNGSTLEITGIRAEKFDKGISVNGASSCKHSGYIRVDTNTSVELLDDQSLYFHLGGIDRLDEQSIVNSEKATMAFVSDNDGELSWNFIPKLNVGTFENPGELAVGEGNSHTYGLASFRSESLEAGPFTDVTAIMKSRSGSTAKMFSEPSVPGECFYVGGDRKYPGLKIETTALANANRGDIVIEYWNGSTWVEFAIMESRADWPHENTGDFFGSFIGGQQIRFEDFQDDWELTTVNGVEAYYVRGRVVNTFTDSPELESIKLHVNRTEINSSGIIEYFGRGRPRVPMIMHRKLVEAINGTAATNEDIDYASGLSFDGQSNELAQGNTDAVGFSLEIPENADTSSHITVYLDWLSEGNVFGSNDQIDFEYGYALVPFGRGNVYLDGTLPITTVSEILTASDPQRLLQRFEFEFEMHGLVPRDKIVFYLKRYGGSATDTYGGKFVIVDISAYYYKFKE